MNPNFVSAPKQCADDEITIAGEDVENYFRASIVGNTNEDSETALEDMTEAALTLSPSAVVTLFSQQGTITLLSFGFRLTNVVEVKVTLRRELPAETIEDQVIDDVEYVDQVM